MELEHISKEIAREITEQVRAYITECKKPQYYKFPEDIVTMTGGHIPEATIRNWKARGYIKTIKLGRRAFVMERDWDFFVCNHQDMMRKDNRWARYNQDKIDKRAKEKGE